MTIRNNENARTLAFRTLLCAQGARDRAWLAGRPVSGIKVSDDGWFYFRSWDA